MSPTQAPNWFRHQLVFIPRDLAPSCHRQDDVSPTSPASPPPPPSLLGYILEILLSRLSITSPRLRGLRHADVWQSQGENFRLLLHLHQETSLTKSYNERPPPQVNSLSPQTLRKYSASNQCLERSQASKVQGKDGFVG